MVDQDTAFEPAHCACDLPEARRCRFADHTEGAPCYCACHVEPPPEPETPAPSEGADDEKAEVYRQGWNTGHSQGLADARLASPSGAAAPTQDVLRTYQDYLRARSDLSFHGTFEEWRAAWGAAAPQQCPVQSMGGLRCILDEGHAHDHTAVRASTQEGASHTITQWKPAAAPEWIWANVNLWLAGRGYEKKRLVMPNENDIAAAPQSERPSSLCKHAEFGGYRNQVSMNPPARLKLRGPVGVDLCLASEIADLWARSVRTLECCCGHGRKPGYIAVDPEHHDAMIDLGYKPTHDGRFFVPKTGCRAAPQSEREENDDGS